MAATRCWIVCCNDYHSKKLSCPQIAAALKCKPEKLFHIELDHRPIARKTIKEYAIFLRLVMQYAEREYGIDNDTQTLAVKGTRSRPVDCLHP